MPANWKGGCHDLDWLWTTEFRWANLRKYITCITKYITRIHTLLEEQLYKEENTSPKYPRRWNWNFCDFTTELSVQVFKFESNVCTLCRQIQDSPADTSLPLDRSTSFLSLSYFTVEYKCDVGMCKVRTNLLQTHWLHQWYSESKNGINTSFPFSKPDK